jgi:hypothetical protein
MRQLEEHGDLRSENAELEELLAEASLRIEQLESRLSQLKPEALAFLTRAKRAEALVTAGSRLAQAVGHAVDVLDFDMGELCDDDCPGCQTHGSFVESLAAYHRTEARASHRSSPNEPASAQTLIG